VAIRPAGATLANSHYLAYDASLPANDTTILTIGITLAATDVVTVYAGSANVAFGLYGCEIT
jgi:long-subunit fatty acid transport protein